MLCTERKICGKLYIEIILAREIVPRIAERRKNEYTYFEENFRSRFMPVSSFFRLRSFGTKRVQITPYSEVFQDQLPATSFDKLPWRNGRNRTRKGVRVEYGLI